MGTIGIKEKQDGNCTSRVAIEDLKEGSFKNIQG